MLYSQAYIDYNSVIFYVHLPKSGGTSVRVNLSKYFNENQILRIVEPGINHLIGNHINSSFKFPKRNILKEKKIEIKSYIKSFFKKRETRLNFWKENENLMLRDFNSLTTQEKQNLRFISSSYERMTIPNIPGKHFLKILTIRDPISRLQSYYHEAKSKGTSKPYQKIAHKYGINDFIKYLYNERPYMVKNPYCVCLTGTQNFLIAKKIIDNEFFLSAPIEKLDTFLNLIGLKIDSEKRNFERLRVSKTNTKKIIISDELVNKITTTNKADIDLKKHIDLEFNNICENFTN